jgi:3-oxoacyl-[acyl-carrier protein] reductase
MGRLDGKVCVITGAGGGMGREAAIVFAGEGAKVCVADVDSSLAKETVSLCEGPGEAFAVHANVADEGDVERMYAATAERFGRIDVLYNNAGIPMGATPIEEVEDAFFDKTMAVNVRSVHLGAKHVVPHMKRQGGGVILSTASTAGIRPRPGLSAYAASKGAVIAFTKALAIELAPFKIRVVSINPVATDTPMLPSFFGKGDPVETRAKFLSTIPLGRFNTPSDIAQAALYLASDDAYMVTGTAFEIDGGRDI